MLATKDINIEFPLNQIFLRCETECVQACCGADAYDISPIHIASIISKFGGTITESTLRELREQAVELEMTVNSNPSNVYSYSLSYSHGDKRPIGSFTPQDLKQIAREILDGLDFAQKIVRFSQSLEKVSEK